jgi:hypothetical protein
MAQGVGHFQNEGLCELAPNCSPSIGNCLEHPHQCLVCDSAKMFLTFKFSYLLLCKPNYKTERETTNMWKLLIANHLGQSLCLANQKRGALIGTYLLHSSLLCAQLYCAFYQPQQTVHLYRNKTDLLS